MQFGLALLPATYLSRDSLGVDTVQHAIVKQRHIIGSDALPGVDEGTYVLPQNPRKGFNFPRGE